MDKFDHSIRFYKRISELQEKLRKSEEERLELEERFSALMKSCREEEEAKVISLRKQYDKFLKEDIKRRDRNERILHMLESVENRASTLAAKTDRMQLLRRHFEARLLQVYPNWKRNVDSGCSVTTPKPWERKMKPKIIPSSSLYELSSPIQSDRSATFHLPHEEYLSKLPSLYSSIDTKDTVKPSINVQNTEGQSLVSSLDAVVDFHLNEEAVVEKSLFDSGVTNIIEDLDKQDQLSGYIKKAARQLNYKLDENKNFRKSENDDSFLQVTEGKIGNSVDIEYDQATSKDLLNVSLSDDGILQDEMERLTTVKNKSESSGSRKENELRNDMQLHMYPKTFKDIEDVSVKHVKEISGSTTKSQPYNLQDVINIHKESFDKTSVEESKPKEYDESLKKNVLFEDLKNVLSVDIENDNANSAERVVGGMPKKYPEQEIGNQNSVQFQNQNILQEKYETVTPVRQMQNSADEQIIQHNHTVENVFSVDEHQQLHYPEACNEQVELDNNQQHYQEINNRDLYQPELSENQYQPELSDNQYQTVLDNGFYQYLQQSPQAYREGIYESGSIDNQYQTPQQIQEDNEKQYQAENFEPLQQYESDITSNEYQQLQYEMYNEQYLPNVSDDQYMQDVSDTQYQSEIYSNLYEQQYQQINNDQYTQKLSDDQSELFDNSYQQQYEQVNNENQYPQKVTDDQCQSELHDSSYHQQYEEANSQYQQYQQVNNDEQYLPVLPDEYQQLENQYRFTSEYDRDTFHQLHNEQQNGLVDETLHQESGNRQYQNIFDNVPCNSLDTQSQQAFNENLISDAIDQDMTINKNNEHQILDNQNQISDKQVEVNSPQISNTKYQYQDLGENVQHVLQDNTCQYQLPSSENNEQVNVTSQGENEIEDVSLLQEGSNSSFIEAISERENTSDSSFFESGKYHERTAAYEADLDKKLTGFDECVKLQESEGIQGQEITTQKNLKQYHSMFQNAGDSDPTGFSDMDDVEDQLAELVCENQRKQVTFSAQDTSSFVSDKTSTAQTSGGTQNDKILKLQTSETTPVDDKVETENVDASSSFKDDKHVTLVKPTHTQKQVAKKLPNLSRMLESDTESLKIDSDPSNNDSDDFDFKSES